MMIVGALIAFLWSPIVIDIGETVEFVGGLIGILGVAFFISGLFYTKEPVMS